jgi:hypothetical protein
VSGKNTGPSAYMIERVIAAWERIRARLENDPELADDEQAITRALAADPNNTHPDKLIERLVHAIAFATAREAEAKALQAIMQARKLRYAKRLADMKSDLFAIMQALEYKRYRALEGTVVIRQGVQSVLITDEEAIPDDYFKTTKKLKKRELLDDLKQGAIVEGAFLSNGAQTLSITGIQPATDSLGETDDEAEDGDGEGGEPASGAENAASG